MEKTIIFIDNNTKKYISMDILSLLENNVRVINRIQEVDFEYLEGIRDIVVIDEFFRQSGFIGDSVSYLEMLKFFYGCSIHYIFFKEETRVSGMERVSKVYNINPDMIDKELLEDVIYGKVTDVSEALIDSETLSDLNEVADNLIKYNDVDYILSHIKDIKLICIEYMKLSLESRKLQMQLDSLKIEKGLSDELLNDNVSTIKNLIEVYDDVVGINKRLRDRYTKLSFQVSRDMQEVVDVGVYKDRPLIVYIKEFVEPAYLSTFLRVLKEAINLRLQLNCKVLQLVDKSFSKRLSTVPDYYYIAMDKFNTKEVLLGDYLLKQGEYRNILEILLTNKMIYDVLIIYDRKDGESPILEGSSVLYFDMCFDANDVEVLGLDPVRAIVNYNYGGDIMQWDVLLDYDKLSDNALLTFYRLADCSAISEILRSLEFLIENEE